MVVSSCSTMPLAAASSPTWIASVAVVSSTEGSTGLACQPCCCSSWAKVEAWGEATRTRSEIVFSMTLSTGPVAITRPRPITISSSAVWLISLIRCEEMNTVRPSLASWRQVSRTQITPSGSRPLTGSSKIKTSGSPSSAAAIPRRWPMPREKPLTRLLATALRPVNSSTSSTRRVGIPFESASCLRWARAVREPCRPLASSRAPTSVSGAARSR